MLHFQETSRQADIVGRVADFCPICRQIQPFTIRKQFTVRERGIVLFAIPVLEEVESTETGADRVCEVCNLDLATVPSRYNAVLNRPDLGLEELLKETNPNLRETITERLALEEQVRASRLLPEQRRQFLLEPFQLLDSRLKSVMGPGGGPLFFSVLTLVPFSIVGLVIAGIFPKTLELLAIVCAVTLVVSILVLVSYGFRYTQKRAKLSLLLRTQIHPMLARALRSLSPSPAELNDLLKDLRKKRLISGSVVNPESILAEMRCIR